MDFEEAKTLIDSARWYHRWEILPDVMTPGRSYTSPAAVLDQFGVDQDLSGKRVLDIGSWDGPYSFELERRGAEVVSYDIQDPNATAYNVAREILDSKCEYMQGSVYDLDTANFGKFDLVLFLGFFYHLKNPNLAWERIRCVLKPTGKLLFEGAILDFADRVDELWKQENESLNVLRDLSVTYFTSGDYSGCWSNWYVPTKACLGEWLLSAGYQILSLRVIEESSRAYGMARIDSGADLREHGISNANLR